MSLSLQYIIFQKKSGRFIITVNELLRNTYSVNIHSCILGKASSNGSKKSKLSASKEIL